MRFYKLLLICLILPVTGSAQEISPDDSQIFIALGQYTELDPNGFHMNQFKKFSPNIQNPYTQETNQQLGNVVKHMRFNKGRNFPEQENMEQRAKELIDKMLAEDLESQGFISGPSKEDLIVPRILPCLGNNTKKVPINTSQVDEDKISFDWLFLRSTAPPQKTLGKYFGKSISVLKVKDDATSAGGIAAQGFQVKCLPTRFRGTKGNWYRHEGEDALKNYDENRDGKGKLHDYVKKNKSKFY